MSNLMVFKNKYVDQRSIPNIIDYLIKNEDYLGEKKEIVFNGGNGVIEGKTEVITESFMAIKRLYNKTDGRQLHHFVIEIKEKHLTKQNDRNKYAVDVGIEVSGHLYDIGYQNYFSVHCDKEGSHVHFCVNSINYKTGCRIKNESSFYENILYFIIKEFPYLKIEQVYYQDSKLWSFDYCGNVNGGYYINGIHNR